MLAGAQKDNNNHNGNRKISHRILNNNQQKFVHLIVLEPHNPLSPI